MNLINNTNKQQILNIKDGMKFAINIIDCEDEDLLKWLENQPENEFVAEHVEQEANGIWIENCDFRIGFKDISLIPEKESLCGEKNITIDDLKPLKEIFIESTQEYGRIHIHDISYLLAPLINNERLPEIHGKMIIVEQRVYEDDYLNKITDEEFNKLFNGNKDIYTQIPVKEEYHAHCILEVNKDDNLYITDIDFENCKQEYQTKILKWVENYAKSKGYKGVIIRTSRYPINNLVFKYGYKPIYTNDEEKVEFEKMLNMDSKEKIKYDENGNPYCYWIKSFQ